MEWIKPKSPGVTQLDPKSQSIDDVQTFAAHKWCPSNMMELE